MASAPNNEAHGAYTFYGLAYLSNVDAPLRSLARNLNMPSLISCLSSLQHAPEPGFAGRTNKLVDGGARNRSEAAGRLSPRRWTSQQHSPWISGQEKAWPDTYYAAVRITGAAVEGQTIERPG